MNREFKEKSMFIRKFKLLVYIFVIAFSFNGSFSFAKSFSNAINVAISLIDDNINDKIVREIESSSYLQRDYIDDIGGAL